MIVPPILSVLMIGERGLAVQDLSLPGVGVCVPASRTRPRNASGGRRGRWSREAGLRGGWCHPVGLLWARVRGQPSLLPSTPLAKVQDLKVTERPLWVPTAWPREELNALVSSVLTHTCFTE